MTVSQITPKEVNEKVESMNIYFSGNVAGINFSGPILFKEGEFEEFIKVDKMKEAVRQKVIEKIMNGESPTA